MATNEGVRKWESSKTQECVEFEFDWTITSFMKFAEFRGNELGPNFGGPTKFGEVECGVVALVYQGENDPLEDYLSTYLTPYLNRPCKFMVQFEVSILAADRQKHETKSIELMEYQPISCGQDLFPLKVIKKRQDLYLRNGNLTLHFEGKIWITLESSEKTFVPETTSPDFNVPTMIMKNLFESGNNSDVTIKAGSREFKCHKCVLSIRSEYFRVMFESGMKESQEGVVDFSDQMDGDVLKDLLEYLYLGMASNLKKTCQNMLKIADMFQLDDLKYQSEEAFIRQLCPDNAWDMKVLAREQGAKKLQKKAISLFNKCL